MLTTTEAIILSLQPHTDRAHILHTYTRAHGRANYMVYGLGRKKSSAQYAPLSIVEIVADERPNRPIQTLCQASVRYIAQQTISDPRRQAIALFVAEVLYRVVRHPMEDDDLYELIAATAHEINESEHPENTHLRFLQGLAEAMGIGIDDDEQPQLTTEPKTRQDRQAQLRALCHYFEMNMDGWETPKSMEILSQIFD